jgi:hypothetical protein
METAWKSSLEPIEPGNACLEALNNDVNVLDTVLTLSINANEAGHRFCAAFGATTARD